jgi:hypothetical protein
LWIIITWEKCPKTVKRIVWKKCGKKYCEKNVEKNIVRKVWKTCRKQ